VNGCLRESCVAPHPVQDASLHRQLYRPGERPLRRAHHEQRFGLLAGGLRSSLTQSDLVVFVALTSVLVSLLSLQGPFWAFPPTFLGGAAAAGGIGPINTIVTGFGGFIGPALLGVLKESTGGPPPGMAALAVASMLTAIIVPALGRGMAPRVAMQ